MDIYNIVSIAIVCLVIFMIFTSKSKTNEHFKFRLPNKKDFSKAKSAISKGAKKAAVIAKNVGKKIATGSVGLVNKISRPRPRQITLSEDDKKIVLLIDQSKLANQKKIFTLYLIKKTLAKIAYLNVLIEFTKNIVLE
jgi:hypothetical protein